jgi:PAS domain S-box-containing protein
MPGERLLDAIFKAEPLGVFLVDGSGEIHEVNPAAARLVEVAEDDQILGRKLSVFLDPSSRDRAALLIGKACAGEKSKAELDIVGREGGRRCLRCHLVPMSDHEDDADGAVILAHDATEEILARRALERSEERFRTFFEKNLAASYICRADGELVKCNQAFVGLFGFESREEALATPVWDYFQEPADRESFLNIIREEGSISLQEGSYVRRSGEAVFALESAVDRCLIAADLRESV